MFDRYMFYVDGNTVRVIEPTAPVFEVVQGHGGTGDSISIPSRRKTVSVRTDHCTESASKRIISLCLLLALCCAFLCLGVSRVPGGTVYNAESSAQVLVRPGDTIWSIAREHPVDGFSTNEIVSYICEVNDLSSDVIHAGTRLTIPA